MAKGMGDGMKRPTVSVGLPTYNRAPQLRRAVESVLAQDYQQIELVISDNASADETELFCREIMERDSRVRYIRQPVNRGLTDNCLETLRKAEGEFFLWLSDDDWLSSDYISSCLRVFAAHDDYVSVFGTAKYFQGDTYFFESEIELLQDDAGERVLEYLKSVGRNATFYGVMRRESLAKLTLANAIGGDWMLVAAVVFSGKTKLLKDVFINRSVGGNSDDFVRLTKTLRLPRYHAVNPFLTLALSLFQEIAWRSPVYRILPATGRMKLAFAASWIVLRKHAIPYSKYQLRRPVRGLLLRAASLSRKVRMKLLRLSSGKTYL